MFVMTCHAHWQSLAWSVFVWVLYVRMKKLPSNEHETSFVLEEPVQNEMIAASLAWVKSTAYRVWCGDRGSFGHSFASFAFSSLTGYGLEEQCRKLDRNLASKEMLNLELLRTHESISFIRGMRNLKRPGNLPKAQLLDLCCEMRAAVNTLQCWNGIQLLVAITGSIQTNTWRTTQCNILCVLEHRSLLIPLRKSRKKPNSKKSLEDLKTL